MAIRFLILARNLLGHYRVPKIFLMKKLYQFGNRLISILTCSRLSFITRKCALPLVECVKKCGIHPNYFFYRVATVDDKDAILNLLRKFPYPDDPILGQIQKYQLPKMSLLLMGVSVVAIDAAKNQIIGVVIGDIFTPTSTRCKLQEAERIKESNKEWSNVLVLLAHLEEKAKLFERYKVKKALNLCAVAIDEGYRDTDVTAKLIQATKDNGRLLGYQLAAMHCTGHYTIELCENLKLQCVHNLKYTEFKDSNGNQVFNPSHPHTHCAMYAKLLNWNHFERSILN